MNAGFTLAHARARVDYFAALGVSHLYLSPIFAARRGSMHGYDVVDPARVNPEVGDEGELRALSADLHARGMGLILDIVPNHMGIGPENRYWDDVLTYGERSSHAKWFDIDWTAGHGPHRTLTLPVLGDELENVIGRGELSIEVQRAVPPRLRYFAHSFPLDPASLPPDLQLAQVDPEEARELADAYSRPEMHDRLRALLDAQHYRLEFWRRGPRDINYRRFFDVNDLAALRMEDPAVFTETHDFVLGLVRDGMIDGLRVDHVDGLLDPATYLARLRAATTPETLIFVEKILSPDEQLVREWPIHGTTGYEFLNDLEDTLLDPAGLRAIEDTYRGMREMGTDTFAEIARRGKAGVLNGPLHADVDRLVALLSPIARACGHRWPDRHLTSSVIDFIAALPVYRTYLGADGIISASDRKIVERTSRDAQTNSAHPEIVGFIGDVIVETPAGVRLPDRVLFAQRLQQLSGPAAAKGVEDTALYDYVPLASRNEVGGAPDRALTKAVQRLHEGSRQRCAHFPLALIATNTHDTKRSADVRARLDALAEIPEEWIEAVGRWRRTNARFRRPGDTGDGGDSSVLPDANTEYLFYQSLVGVWPVGATTAHDAARSIGQRLSEYMTKASREAKLRTNWVNPDAAYEETVKKFIGDVLDPVSNAGFVDDLSRMANRVAAIGVRNALSRIAIHLTSPGTPDMYQGDELWNHTLVDPDNRAQVDFESRRAALAELPSIERAIVEGTSFNLGDDKVKLLVSQRLLCLRRSHPAVFVGGNYEPVAVSGPRADNVVVFSRRLNQQRIITVAPRLSSGLLAADALDWWSETAIDLGADASGQRWRNAITGDTFVCDQRVEIGTLLRKLPVAVIAS